MASSAARVSAVVGDQLTKMNELITVTNELHKLLHEPAGVDRADALCAAIDLELEKRIPRESNRRAWVTARTMRYDSTTLNSVFAFPKADEVDIYLFERYRGSIGDNYLHRIASVSVRDEKVFANLVIPRDRGNYPKDNGGNDDDKSKPLFYLTPIKDAGGVEGIAKVLAEAIEAFLRNNEKF